MTSKDDQSFEAVAQSLVASPQHLAGAISSMAAAGEVSASEDLMSSTGIKLLSQGTRIDAQLREKLLGFSLAGQTLEQSLSVAGGVTAESLSGDAQRLIDGDAWFKRLNARSRDSGAIRYDLMALKLPREILFRLTVARDQRVTLYRHLLSVAVISHYVATQLLQRQREIDNLLTAALCHDLGELYIDPTILDSAHRVTDQERRFIYVHPIVGWLIVKDLAGLDCDVADAIIQHQERLDGSGYPNGKRGEEIALSGRILAAADVAASIMARFGDHRRLSTLLRLNNKKYDPAVVNVLHGAILEEAPTASQVEGGVIGRRLTGFRSILDGWARLRAATEVADSVAGRFLSERMFNLRTVVVQFGFDPDSLETPSKLAEEDASIAAELAAVIDELQFQLADLSREYDRNAPSWSSTLDPLVLAALADWRRNLQDCTDDR